MRVGSPLAVLLVSLLAGLPLVGTADANPLVPYCEGSILSGSTQPTVLPQVCEQATGRVFPEAHPHPEYVAAGATGFAKDYVSFFEFQAGLDYLAAQYPDRIEVHTPAESYGLTNGLTQERDRFPVHLVEVTNEKSPVPRAEKLNLLFMLSIHGNEKGGREGGFRVLEDLAAGRGFATETVQNGAGFPGTGPAGEPVETYADYLDFMNVFLLFPNPDGWAHDEVEYASSRDCTALVLYCRGNGDGGTDLNRQLPTIGWQNPNRNVMGEPEAIGYGNWIVEQRAAEGLAWNYAIDIHGMLNHQNFGAIMLPAGSFTPQEMHRSLRLAETLKERMNDDPHFQEWITLLGTAQDGWDSLYAAAGEDVNDQPQCRDGIPPPDDRLPERLCAPEDSPSRQVGSRQFAEYYTVIDAIGYTDSGFSGDFFAQTTGLNAPGYDIELAYNHITTDSQYEAGSLFNDFHVHMVRHIVKSFLDSAALDVQISYETGGLRTLYVPPEYVATNIDDAQATPGGWADENPGDDAWDYGPDQPFTARPAKYWEDLRPFLCEACGSERAVPGVLEARPAAALDADVLASFDNLVIPGTAVNQFVQGAAGENGVADGAVDEARVQAVLDWVEAGGNLVLTDAGLEFLDLSGVTDDRVDRVQRYMGGIKMDLTHPLLEKVRGGVKQTYEPTPLGYAVGANAAPNWFVDPAAVTGLGGEVAGLECGTPQLSDPCAGNGAGLGLIPYGEGRIQFIGSLLPDPTEEFYHPYGLDHYATTYSGNQVLRNMLDWTEVFAAPPIVLTDGGQIVQSDNEPTVAVTEAPAGEGQGEARAPSLSLAALAAGLGLAAWVIRRRR